MISGLLGEENQTPLIWATLKQSHSIFFAHKDDEACPYEEALKKKDGLVEPDKQDKLREQIENAFSDENLDNLSAEIETGTTGTELDR